MQLFEASASRRPTYYRYRTAACVLTNFIFIGLFQQAPALSTAAGAQLERPASPDAGNSAAPTNDLNGNQEDTPARAAFEPVLRTVVGLVEQELPTLLASAITPRDNGVVLAEAAPEAPASKIILVQETTMKSFGSASAPSQRNGIVLAELPPDAPASKIIMVQETKMKGFGRKCEGGDPVLPPEEHPTLPPDVGASTGEPIATEAAGTTNPPAAGEAAPPQDEAAAASSSAPAGVFFQLGLTASTGEVAYGPSVDTPADLTDEQPTEQSGAMTGNATEARSQPAASAATVLSAVATDGDTVENDVQASARQHEGIVDTDGLPVLLASTVPTPAPTSQSLVVPTPAPIAAEQVVPTPVPVALPQNTVHGMERIHEAEPVAPPGAAIVATSISPRQPVSTNSDREQASVTADDFEAVSPTLPPDRADVELAKPSSALSIGNSQDQYSALLLTLIGVVAAVLLGGLCLASGFSLAAMYMLKNREDKGGLRTFIESLPECKADEVEQRLPTDGGYDCAFSKPQSSRQLLRLEGEIDGPVSGGAVLMAPLTRQPCVLYSTAVSRPLHDGMPSAPVAFGAANTDFIVTLDGGSQIRIELEGEDVSLFDMRGGRCAVRHAFAEAPDHWQDFVQTHRATPLGNDSCKNVAMRVDGSMLEFQECSLLVGARITLVGELHRAANGALSLRPWHVERAASSDKPRAEVERKESWRTSWECGGCEVAMAAVAESVRPTPAAAGAVPAVLMSKVVISDDPSLFGETLQPRSWGSVISGAGDVFLPPLPPASPQHG